MTEQKALLRAILDDPLDDTVRLAYADWLDEHPGTTTCPVCARPPDAKNHVTGHMFVGWGHGWQPCSRCDTTTLVPDGRAKHAHFIRRQISHSKLARDRTRNEKLRKAAKVDRHGWAEEWLGTDALGRHYRGFIGEITTTMPRFLECAEKWLSAHPITDVRLEDMDSGATQQHRYGWYCRPREYTLREDDDVLEKVWDLLLHTGLGVRGVGWVWYDSEDQADLALSRACVLYGRKLAGLTERTLW